MARPSEAERRRIAISVIAAGAVGVALTLVVFALNTLHPANPIGPLRTYTEVQKEALSSLQALVDSGIATTSGLVGLFGAAVMGFHERLNLSRAEAIGASCALFFCVLSSLMGAYAKVKIVEMLGTSDMYILDPVIIWPLSIQLYSAVGALACLAGVVAHKSLAASAKPKKAVQS